jgi:hypothetical protein
MSGSARRPRRADEKEVFFFEKKNQKTFTPLAAAPTSQWAAHAKEQKFFGSFFQKKNT